MKFIVVPITVFFLSFSIFSAFSELQKGMFWEAVVSAVLSAIYLCILQFIILRR